MKKIICTRGIPASGKTSWSKEQWGFHITKDALRRQYPDKKEAEIVDLERNIINKEVEKETPLIIIDNTHLWEYNKHIEYYKALAKANNYIFEIKDFYCSVEQAIKRDKREHPVWEEVIRRLAKTAVNWWLPKYPIFNTITSNSRPVCAIFDIDWTLAWATDRDIYDFKKVIDDKVNPYVATMLKAMKEINCRIIIVSWRDNSCFEQTVSWLNKNGIEYDNILMRATWDKRGDEVVKKELYEQHIKDIYNVFAVFDDRNKVVDMWRLECNLPTYQVWYGNF